MPKLVVVDKKAESVKDPIKFSLKVLKGIQYTEKFVVHAKDETPLIVEVPTLAIEKAFELIMKAGFKKIGELRILQTKDSEIGIEKSILMFKLLKLFAYEALKYNDPKVTEIIIENTIKQRDILKLGTKVLELCGLGISEHEIDFF